MKIITFFIFALFTLSLTFDDEFAVTKEKAKDLKRNVNWKIRDLSKNVFKGWTKGDVRKLLTAKPMFGPTTLTEKKFSASLDASYDPR